MPSERVSTFLGAPPNKWKKLEIEQIKQIHRAYRNAFSTDFDDDEVVPDINDISNPDGFSMLLGSQTAENAKKGTVAGRRNLTTDFVDEKDIRRKAPEDGDDVGPGDRNDDIDKMLDNSDEKRDEEFFLPKDSPLRSKNGDKKAPAHATFKDHENFLHTCEFDFWRQNFEGQSMDRFLSEVAETIVSNICLSQSRKELRVRHGSVPGGRFLRAKREQITPLALCLHETKLWATNILRTSSIYEEDTYKDIKYRILYIDYLSQKEVWGDAANFVAAGMRPIAHEKLFRLLLTMKEALERAYEYAYRGYCRRSSREKLARLGNLMKNVVLREIKILSALMTINDKLVDPKTHRIQPTDLLNHVKNQSFVDFRNMINVMMFELCQLPLVRAALTSDYDGKDVQKSLGGLAAWSENNLFCRPGMDGPEYLFDEDVGNGLMPIAYTKTAEKLAKLLKEHDPHAKLPLTAKKHMKMLKKAYGSEEEVENVMKLMLKSAAAIQELIPGLYATHVLWGIAGDGGDFTVYDTLREQVIRVMSNTIDRVFAVQTTEGHLLNKIGEIGKAAEQAMEAKRLKTKKAKYKPAWLVNLTFIKTDFVPASKKGYVDLFRQLWEIAKDAWEYSLTSEELDDKVESARKMCDAITGGLPGSNAYHGNFNSSQVMQVGNSKDWLNIRSEKITKAPTKQFDDISSEYGNADEDSDSDGY